MQRKQISRHLLLIAQLFTWPNQDDWMNMTEIGEHEWKIDNDQQYFGHIHPLMFVVVKIQLSTNVKVRRYEFIRTIYNWFSVILI